MKAARIDLAHVRRTGLLRWLWVLLASVGATLRVSVQGLWHMYRGTLTQAYADARLNHWSKRLLELVQLRLQVIDRGFRFEPGQPYILMCNHSSHYDIPITFQSVPGSIRMVAKKELFSIPLWGAAMRATDFIAIDRKNTKQAMRDLEQARERMERGIMVWIAPEGTRSRNGRLGPLKKGGFILALDTNAIILPIGIRGAKEILPADTLSISLGCEVEVHYGTPVRASDYGQERRGEMIEEVERQLLELAQVERQNFTR